MKKAHEGTLGEDLTNYLELLRAKLIFTEELYGIKMNYVLPIIERGSLSSTRTMGS